MSQPANTPIQSSARTVRNPDVLVVGAGVFGLWAARRAIRAGKSVLVLEKRGVGAGASGGFLGALMPHMPDRWNPKKQFQFDALDSIGEAIAALEADTGIICGFRRCGRLMPVNNEQTLTIIEKRIEGARQHWRGYQLELLNPPFAGTPAQGWLDEDQARFGATFDTLSARVDPRAYVEALAAHVRAHGELREGCEVASIDPKNASVSLSDGSSIAAGEVIIAAGWEAYRLLAPFMGELAVRDGPYANGLPGRGVKGQALLLGLPHADDRPIIYHNGAYVVPHTGNRIAIGSTTVEDWQNEPAPGRDEFDASDMAFHEDAIVLAPALSDAPVIERWANVRPRNMLAGRGTEPFMGKMPDHDRLTALIGGFRIGLAVAHMQASE